MPALPVLIIRGLLNAYKLMKWLEKEKPEVYKEAMEHILKELGKLKMEE